MKRRNWYIPLVLIALILIGCQEPVNSVEKIVLDKIEVVIMAGDTVNLKAEIFPVNAENGTLTWSSEDESVATVDAKGNITAVSVGDTKITAVADNGVKVECKVSVGPRVPTDLSLDVTTLDLELGRTRKLVATITPDNVVDSTIRWTSSDEAKVSVDSKGVITAHEICEGVVITAKTHNDIKATCTVDVVPVAITKIEAKYLVANADRGSETSLSEFIDVEPADADISGVVWSCPSPDIVKIENGKLKALSVGTGDSVTVSVNVSYEPLNFKDSFYLKVNEVYPQRVDLSETSLQLVNTEEETITASVFPSYAADNDVVWTTDDDTVATVENGTIKAVGVGTAEITATARNASAKCTVEVTPRKTTGISLNKTSVTIEKGKSDTSLKATRVPDYSDEKVEWSSSNDTIVSVDENGRLTGNSAGGATITATSGDFSADCTVTVVIPATDVNVTLKYSVNEDLSFPYTESILEMGREYDFGYEFTPKNTTDGFTLKSSDENVLKIENSKIIAKSIGEAKLQFVDESETVRFEFEYQVKPMLSSIKIELVNPPAGEVPVYSAADATGEIIKITRDDEGSDVKLGIESFDGYAEPVFDGTKFGNFKPGKYKFYLKGLVPSVSSEVLIFEVE